MKTSTFRFASLLLFIMAASPALRADDFFLQLDDVKGDSTESAFKDQMVATGFKFSITTIGGGVNTQAGKAVPGDLVITKFVDVASPILALSSSSGKPYAQALLSVTRPIKGENKVIYTITLSNVRVTGIMQTGATATAGGSPLAAETVSLSYSKVVWAFGSTKTGYDFAQNKGANVQPNSNANDGVAGVSAKAFSSDSTVSPSK